MKKAGIVVVAIAGLLVTSSVASAQVCVLGILAKALYANYHDNRELTEKEAMTCGLLKEDEAKPEAKKGKKKLARAAKKN